MTFYHEEREEHEGTICSELNAGASLHNVP